MIVARARKSYGHSFGDNCNNTTTVICRYDNKIRRSVLDLYISPSWRSGVAICFVYVIKYEP